MNYKIPTNQRSHKTSKNLDNNVSKKRIKNKRRSKRINRVRKNSSKKACKSKRGCIRKRKTIKRKQNNIKYFKKLIGGTRLPPPQPQDFGDLFRKSTYIPETNAAFIPAIYGCVFMIDFIVSKIYSDIVNKDHTYLGPPGEKWKDILFQDRITQLKNYISSKDTPPTSNGIVLCLSEFNHNNDTTSYTGFQVHRAGIVDLSNVTDVMLLGDKGKSGLCSAIILSNKFVQNVKDKGIQSLRFESFNDKTKQESLVDIKELFGNEPMCSVTFLNSKNKEVFKIYTIHSKENVGVSNLKLIEKLNLINNTIPFFLIGDFNEDISNSTNNTGFIMPTFNTSNDTPLTVVNKRTLSQTQWDKAFEDIQKLIDFSVCSDTTGEHFSQSPIRIKEFTDSSGNTKEYIKTIIPTSNHQYDHAMIETDISGSFTRETTTKKVEELIFELAHLNIAGPNAPKTEYFNEKDSAVNIANNKWRFDFKLQDTESESQPKPAQATESVYVTNGRLKTFMEYLDEEIQDRQIKDIIKTNMLNWAKYMLPRYLKPIQIAAPNKQAKHQIEKLLKSNNINVFKNKFNFTDGIWPEEQEPTLFGVVALLSIQKIVGSYIKNNPTRDSCSINKNAPVPLLPLSNLYSIFKNTTLFGAHNLLQPDTRTIHNV